MKKRIIAVFAAALMAFSAAACGSETADTGADEVVSEAAEAAEEAAADKSVQPSGDAEQAQDNEKTESAPTKAKSAVPSGGVEFSVVSIADFDDQLAEIAVGQGVEIEYGQSAEEGEEQDERLTFTASDDVCAKIAAEYKAWLETETLSDLDEGETTIRKVTISDDFSSVEFRVTDNYENTFDALIVLGYLHPMSELQMLSGTEEDDISVKLRVVNDTTDEVISETTLPDDLRTSDTE